ncbi:MAG: ribonuclease H [Patescibacteria group bacterium]|nr:ribonuclease H [bacterium]MDZ4241117.1 ribonuclease H [Patescibacteria group bacterium]
MKNQTIIFADGASSGNPGNGGWGSIIVQNETVAELGGAAKNVTNNAMELEAVVRGLSAVKNDTPIILFTDSAYVVNGAQKWLTNWQTRGWKTKAKKEVANLSLWQDLARLISEKQIEWRHVSGHSGLPGNERVDMIAASFSTSTDMKLYIGPLPKYGIDILNTDYDEGKREKREEGKSRKNVKAYSYVSLLDGVIRIHTTWGECEKAVKGKPARFRKTSDDLDETALIKEYEGLGGRVV